MNTVLIIDDNPDHRIIHRIWLEGAGYDVIDVDNGADALRRTILDKPDCILVDYLIGGENGFALLHQMLRDVPDCPPIILLTCALSESLERNSLALGAFACFDKTTLVREDLFRAIHEAIGGKV